MCGELARSCSCYRVEMDTIDASSGAAERGHTKTTPAKKKKDKPVLAVATSEYDYDAPSSVYLSLRVGCEVRKLPPSPSS